MCIHYRPSINKTQKKYFLRWLASFSTKFCSIWSYHSVDKSFDTCTRRAPQNQPLNFVSLLTLKSYLNPLSSSSLLHLMDKIPLHILINLQLSGNIVLKFRHLPKQNVINCGKEGEFKDLQVEYKETYFTSYLMYIVIIVN
jgi:hypothetical protein